MYNCRLQKSEKFTLTEKTSSNQLFSNFFSTYNIYFHEIFAKKVWEEISVISTVGRAQCGNYNYFFKNLTILLTNILNIWSAEKNFGWEWILRFLHCENYETGSKKLRNFTLSSWNQHTILFSTKMIVSQNFCVKWWQLISRKILMYFFSF